MAFDLDQAVAKVEERLANTDETTAWPVLIMLCGLPATGKSYLARCLVEQMPFVIVETDFVRKTLFPSPTYSAQESNLVHDVCHALMGKLLKCGARVIFDATNLLEFHREKVYRLARSTAAKLVVVQTVASETVVKERLEKRKVARNPADISDANWAIYQRMASVQQPIGHPHLTIDTSGDLEAAVNKILRMIQK
jgi:predicted kinase